jgi:crotonobetaine/carnitine-CoA ligase
MPALSTFAQRWRSAVDTVPDRPFLVFEASDGEVTRFSYAEMDWLVDDVARSFAGRGVASRSVVQLVQTNSVAFVATWLACARLGAAIVPSDPQATTVELAEHARRTGPVLAVTLPERVADHRRAIETAGLETELLVVDAADSSAGPLRAEGSGPLPPVEVRPATRLAVMFTSGTTSAPKGVELTQNLYAFTGDVMAAVSGLTRFDRQLVVLPMFHANAQYYSVAAAVSVGASVALMHAFSASRFVEQARRHGATHASLFAAPIRMILARTPAGTKPLSLRHAWFAQNLPTSQYREISALLGCEPRQLYGLTETGPAVLVNPPTGAEPTAIGLPTLGCEVRVVGPGWRPVEPGEPGSIQVRGVPGATLFQGYLDDPATTDTAFVERRGDGSVWFDTGDTGTVDERGFHYFGGRRSDVLKVAGENVSIVEIEHTLAEHPAVTEVAVIGVDDATYDEIPVAFVVVGGDLGHGGEAEAELRRWAEARLAPSKRPREYRFVSDLPRTSVGKIRKFLLTTEPRSSVASERATDVSAIEQTSTEGNTI